MTLADDGRIVIRKQFEFIEDKNGNGFKRKFTSMTGVKSNRQLSRIIKSLIEKKLCIVYGDYIIINPIYFNPTTGYVQIPIEVNKKTIWIKQALDFPNRVEQDKKDCDLKHFRILDE